MTNVIISLSHKYWTDRLVKAAADLDVARHGVQHSEFIRYLEAIIQECQIALQKTAHTGSNTYITVSIDDLVAYKYGPHAAAYTLKTANPFKPETFDVKAQQQLINYSAELGKVLAAEAGFNLTDEVIKQIVMTCPTQGAEHD